MKLSGVSFSTEYTDIHTDYAIVIPLLEKTDDVYLLMEVRAEGISQAGDPCFPGGRIEPGETPMSAAKREMQEELGICPERMLGQLSPVRTYRGSLVSVYVCTVAANAADKIHINSSEVAEVLQIPLSFLLAHDNVTEFTFQHHRIWGMSARAIRDL